MSRAHSLATLAALALLACGSDSPPPGNSTFDGSAPGDATADTNPPPQDAGTDTTPPKDSSTPPVDSGPGTDAGPNPPPPSLGALLDRVGRPFVNVAMTDPFNILSGRTVAQVQDDYNSANDPTFWVQLYSALISNNLKFWDSIDGTCGNQLLAGATAAPGRYDALGKLFADDKLYLDTSKTTCTHYLGLELNVPNECGGRTPLEDATDATYTALVGGINTSTTYVVADGVAADADGAPNLTTFPFLGAPNP